MYNGLLKDLDGQLDETIQYHLHIGDHAVHLNQLLGTHIRLEHNGEKNCVLCGRKVTKLFDRGYCFPCVRSRPETDLCQVKPHECHYETCRDQTWGDRYCMTPTYLYLAKSSDIKVGISRSIPGRWVDQGAVEAVVIAQAPNRKVAGELEYHLAQSMPDKTDWRKMLKGEVVASDLAQARDRVLSCISEPWREYLLPDQEIVALNYPVNTHPSKVSSLNLDKGPVEGELWGIKGSYLILSSGVLNVGKWVGYHVTLEIKEGATTAAR